MHCAKNKDHRAQASDNGLPTQHMVPPPAPATVTSWSNVAYTSIYGPNATANRHPHTVFFETALTDPYLVIPALPLAATKDCVNDKTK